MEKYTNEWQPIETAPREGMLVLYDESGAIRMGEFCGWTDEIYRFTDYETPSFIATHWMNPAPPNQGEIRSALK